MRCGRERNILDRLSGKMIGCIQQHKEHKRERKRVYSDKSFYLRGRNLTVTETFSFARLRKSSLADVGVRGLPAETEDAELWRNLGGGVILGGAGMLFLPRLGVRDLPTNAMVLDAEVGV
jgi:hypothetical protein